MKKQIDIFCAVISALPMIVLAVLYSRLTDMPATHMEKDNGLVVSKTAFIFLMAFLCFTGYYLSLVISTRLSFLGWRYLRPAVNILFAVLCVLLILSNTN